METYIVIIAAILIMALLIFYVVRIFNKLIKSRNRVNTQWAQIDVQLTRRADLIPNLVEAVKGYASHEREIFERVTAARNALSSALSPGQAIVANDLLSDQLVRLFAVAEAYPNLKADRNFADLQSNLKETEDKIAYARQFYNDTVLMYRDLTKQFPSSIIAKLFSFEDASFYVTNEDKKDNIEVSF